MQRRVTLNRTSATRWRERIKSPDRACIHAIGESYQVCTSAVFLWRAGRVRRTPKKKARRRTPGFVCLNAVDTVPPGRKKKTFKTRWSGMQAQRRLIANRTPAPNMPSLLRRNSGKPIGGGRGTESFAPLCKSLLALSRLTFGSDHSATRLVFSFTFCRAHRGRTLL